MDLGFYFENLLILLVAMVSISLFSGVYDSCIRQLDHNPVKKETVTNAKSLFKLVENE